MYFFSDTCEVSSKRVNCGWGGISEQQCKARGCCWDNSVVGTVWCSYYKSGNMSGVLITKVVIYLVFLLQKW